MTAAADHVRALRRKGILVHHPRIARSHTIAPGFVPIPRSTIAVPVLSSPAAESSNTRRHHDDFIYVDTALIHSSHPETLVAIEVYGDSMSGRHIADGDIAFVDGSRMPVLGDVVAVAMDGEYVLKTYVVADDEACLRADNPDSADLIPASGRRIRGVVVGLIRRFGLERHPA